MRYLIMLIASVCLTIPFSNVNAQVNVNVNFNLGSQPIWGPTGYDYVENYYLPDIEVYYNVPQHRYYYFEGGLWIGRATLPVRFHHYDLFNSYKIVLNERDPWYKHKHFKEQYAGYRGRHDQQFIRDSRDKKYYIIKNHPQHGKWVEEQKHNNGNHNVQMKGNDLNGKNIEILRGNESGMHGGMVKQNKGNGGGENMRESAKGKGGGKGEGGKSRGGGGKGKK